MAKPLQSKATAFNVPDIVRFGHIDDEGLPRQVNARSVQGRMQEMCLQGVNRICFVTKV